ncbi:thiosulfate oxidation carrier protein SoxY [Oricola cellulosilytica]|uniref:Thiosulfate oxidation carrier protein SoxY n=1 Tax=Oricola cellulosilytica TaxID=1429082 RepID=A0A4R0P528_9HYPH|nr:thiosulfate oxidation carrier protein SoxY [Oricola cellulosilytica]TCD11953.1 thiosulfate oxidation carrier protein SoxY [Oricola cellulosilytica]
MTLTRRSMLTLSAGAAVVTAFGLRAGPAFASAEDAMAKITDFAGGTEPQMGTISLTAPEIAENGNTVPVSVSVDSPMTEEDHVASVAIYADGNPNPEVITFNFTPMSGEASATTRMRLAKTQNVIAVAKTSTGAVFMDKKEVKVTIGGCGG